MASWVFSMMLLSGRVTLIGTSARRTLKRGPLYERYWGFWTKCPVVPVSAANVIGCGGGGLLSDVRKANEGGEEVDSDMLSSILY